MTQSSPTVDRHFFNTVDIVALYLGKEFYRGQLDKIQEIVEFITDDNTKFTFEDVSRHNKIQQWLFNQFKWLGDLHPNYSEFEKWMANVIRNYDARLKLRKLIFS